MDNGIKGKGTIKFTDHRTIIGTGTKFTDQLKPGHSIKLIITPDMLQISDQLVEEVVSDTEVLLKKPGALKFDQNIEYSYKCLPKID